GPALDGRGSDLYVLPGEDLLLAVEREMVGIFTGKYHRQQPCPGDALIDHPLGKPADFHPFSVFSRILVADITFDIELRGLAFQFIGDLPADADHIRQITLRVDLDYFYR